AAARVRNDDGLCSLAGQGEIIACRQARAAAMLLPLIPGQPGRTHQVRHGAGLALRGVAGGAVAVLRPTTLILRPETVDHEADASSRRALAVGLALGLAPAGRPAQ